MRIHFYTRHTFTYKLLCIHTFFCVTCISFVIAAFISAPVAQAASLCDTSELKKGAELKGTELTNDSTTDTDDEASDTASNLTIKAADSLSSTSGIYEIHTALGSASKTIGITDNSTKSGATVQLQKDTNAYAQRFQFIVAGTDSQGHALYRIRTAASGGWLTGNTVPETRVVQKGYSNAKVEAIATWYLIEDDEGVIIYNSANNLALSVKGAKSKNKAPILVSVPDNSKAQHFILSETRLIVKGTYSIYSRLSNTYVLGIANSSTKSLAKATIAKNQYLTSQEWELQYSGSAYLICNLGSEKFLGIKGSKLTSGSTVRQYKSKNNTSRRWFIGIGNRGRVVFINVNSGLAISISGGEATDGAVASQQNISFAKSQQWKLLAVSNKKRAAKIRSTLNISTNYHNSVFVHGSKTSEFQKYIVLHDTEGRGTANNVIEWWASNGNMVAAHFVVNRDGSIVQCVAINKIAHHAGYGDTGHNASFGVPEDGRDDKRGTKSPGSWTRDYGMNSWSIGIEMVHVSGQNYTEAQLDAVDGLIAYIDAYYGTRSTIIDHKTWRIGNSDCDSSFSSYLSNLQKTRTHDGSDRGW